MTIIAGMSFNDYPVIISDLLITGDNHDQFPNSLIPTLSDCEPHLIDSKFSICGMMKKIEIINENFVISWAGDVFEAINIIKALKDKFEKLIPADENILLEIGSSKNVSFIWCVIRDEWPMLNSYNSEVKEKSIKSFDKLIYSGTGSEAIEEAIDIFENKLPVENVEDIVVDSVCSCLFMFSHLMNHELIYKKHANTLKDRFGGGYDVVCFYDGKFRRINDITYLYLDASITKKGMIKIEGSGTLIKQLTDDDVMYIRKINFEFIHNIDNEVLATKIIEDDSYDLTGKISTRKNENKLIQDNDLASSFMCVNVRVKGSDKGSMAYIHKYANSVSAAEKSIRFACQHKFLAIKFNQNYWKEFERNILEFYKS
ncbi:hypothetical protein [Pectobacterium sp. 21LCBS03]|uniref:hypothetical protein n=1 Tax=Pectobacterium sp. 21LCBS03 TaxID=2935858 RepID=UPI00200C8FFB|nr:hypothetical protein [Pectobacterium sp. 21LCBS03]UPY94996.1 hypothetical protein MYB54_21010 [Pectobacterium sp. 21LCBS03]